MTRRRLVLLVLSLYPAWWRDRYGAEAAALLDQSPATVRSALELCRGAVDAWTSQRPPQAWLARFGDEARAVITLAQQEARALHHDYLGTEHVLLGLLAAPESVAARTLTSLGVSPQGVRARVLQIIGLGSTSSDRTRAFTPTSTNPPKPSMCLTPRTKRAFERSCRAADRRSETDVTPVHLLLGVLDEEEGIGAMIVAEVVAPARVRERLAELAA